MATHSRVAAILNKEGFVYTDKDVEDLLKGNQKGVRYGNMVLLRGENGVYKKRFIKIILDGTWKTYQLFRRQVKITAALHEDQQFDATTMAVIKASLGGPIPYAIFETREDGEYYGFMHDTRESYEAFTEQEMRQLVESIYSFHRSGLRIGSSARKYARHIPSRLGYYERECKELLNKRIMHRYRDGSEIEQTVEELLIAYTNMPDIRERVLQLFGKNWEYVRASQTRRAIYLVHADMSVDNVYKHQNRHFELLDFEWVGKVDNPVIAIMYDYGNLRARAWSSPAFQFLLDKTMREIGVDLYQDADMIEAALMLGVVRSSLMMSRYHLDAINTLGKSRHTEYQYYDMYTKTISALIQGII